MAKPVVEKKDAKTQTEVKDFGLRDRYQSAKKVDDFSPAELRFFEVNAIMAKIEEQSTLSNDFKSELQYHFQNFCNLNED